MTRVLLTGGSGFIAAQILHTLLGHGHSVVATVRSEDSATKIRAAYPDTPKSQLDFCIVRDIAEEGAFDEALKSDPPFEAIIHTASPFHLNITDTKKDLLDPAIIGTTGLLKAIKQHAPSVKRVVITSSFASMINGTKGNSWTEHTYTEEDWNPITQREAFLDPLSGYRASKTFAERAAWDFMEKENPTFTLTTMCPPLVFGPIKHHLDHLDSLNTSNQRVRNFIRGDYKTSIPDTGTSFFLWVDVRDLALGHVRAIELPEAANKRFFIAADYFSNKEIGEIIRKNFPEYQMELPTDDIKGGDYPEEGLYKFDHSRTVKLLGIEFRSLEESIVDLVKSLKGIAA
ncbi:putative NADPH-dependent methylglyoxal reductase GRP2 [Rhexocercosporidium sp. MPI-PUGE-AT-0058]|nr:putative NADPH-dependent methylglyoxal reductase GRP2 [Rhexocercosporidium sp. MPI-PUGE-AT-0058]